MNLTVPGNAAIIHIDAPTGAVLPAVHYDGGVFASAESWMKVLGVPKHLRAFFASRLETAAPKLQLTGPTMKAVYKETEVYRFHVADDALEFWYHSKNELYSRSEPRLLTHGEKAEEAKLRQNYQALRFWVRSLGEQVLAKRMADAAGRSKSATPNMQDWENLDEIISKLHRAAVVTGVTLVEHSRKISDIDSIVRRSRGEFITARQGLSELCLDPDAIYQGNQNLQESIGFTLKREDAKRGQPQLTRISGTIPKKPVNTWLREDIYRVAGGLLGKDFSPRLKD